MCLLAWTWQTGVFREAQFNSKQCYTSASWLCADVALPA